MKKYTNWFPPEIKPVHIGVYEVFDEGSYAFWSGKHWGWTVSSVATATTLKEHIEGSIQSRTWRGLTKKAVE